MTQVLTLNQVYTDTLSPAGDEDLYAIYLQGGESYSVSLSSTGGSGGLDDPYVYVYNSNDELVASNDDSDNSLNSFVNYTPPSSGVYFVKASSFSTANDTTGTYNLLVSGPDPQLIEVVGLREDNYWVVTGSQPEMQINLEPRPDFSIFGNSLLEDQINGTYQVFLNGTALYDPVQLNDTTVITYDWEDALGVTNWPGQPAGTTLETGSQIEIVWTSLLYGTQGTVFTLAYDLDEDGIWSDRDLDDRDPLVTVDDDNDGVDALFDSDDNDRNTDNDGDGFLSFEDDNDLDPLLSRDRAGTLLDVPTSINLNDRDEITVSFEDLDEEFYGLTNISWTLQAYNPVTEVVDDEQFGFGSTSFTLDKRILSNNLDARILVQYDDGFGTHVLDSGLIDITGSSFQPPEINGGGGYTPPSGPRVPGNDEGEGYEPPSGPRVPGSEGDGFEPPTKPSFEVPELVIDVTDKVTDLITKYNRGVDDAITVFLPEELEIAEPVIRNVADRAKVREVAKKDIDFIFNRSNGKLYLNADGAERGMKEIIGDTKYGGLIAKIEFAEDTKNRLFSSDLFIETTQDFL